MISIIFTKLKIYIIAAIAIIIIILIAALSFSLLRISKLETTIENLELENKLSKKEIIFFESQIQIAKDFETSTSKIESITNEAIFDSQKQMAIEAIIENFYR